MAIKVLSDPSPSARVPQFVKDAYPGLTLEVERVLPDRNLYLVSLDELLRKTAIHNPPAYQFLKEIWGELAEAVKHMGNSIFIPFPRDCCEVIH